MCKNQMIVTLKFKGDMCKKAIISYNFGYNTLVN